MLKAFEVALAELHALHEASRALHAKDEHGLPCHPLNIAYREALLADWQAVNPKKKLPKKVEKALSEAPHHAEITRQHRAQAQARVEETINGPMREAEARLQQLAEGLEIPKSEEWIQIGDVWASTYGSQGYGAAKYARADAEQVSTKAKFYGLETQIDKIEQFKSDCGAGCSFVVRAQTTELGKEILARKPPLPLREWLMGCKRLGVNPRVYRPFLPYDIEEELGV